MKVANNSIVLLVVSATLIAFGSACGTAPSTGDAASTPTVAPTATPRVVQTHWILTHANYGRPDLGGSMPCPMPSSKSLLTTEKPEVNIDSGTVIVEIKGESYWISNLGLDYLGSNTQAPLSPEKSGTVYIQPADCTVTIRPKDYNLEIK